MTTTIPDKDQAASDSKKDDLEPTSPAPERTPVAEQPPVEEVKVKAKPDPRYIALRNFAASISVFNIFGYTLLGFEQAWIFPIFAIIIAYTTELTLETILAWAKQRRPLYMGNGARGVYEFLLPAHITALAVNMLVYTNDQFLPVMFGVIVGVSGKYILQAPISGRMRHYMNPSNFGIVAVLIFFSRWVAIAQPYMFTENANEFFKIMVVVVILVSGTVLNAMLTKKVALIVGWMGGFAIQAFVRHWIWGVSLFSALGVMTGVAFVLFTNYMITDPGTSPSKPRPQFMFGSGVAFIYAILMQANIVYTLFFATCIVCGLRGGGWWAVHVFKKYRDRRAEPTDGAAPAGLTPEPAKAGA